MTPPYKLDFKVNGVLTYCQYIFVGGGFDLHIGDVLNDMIFAAISPNPLSPACEKIEITIERV